MRFTIFFILLLLPIVSNAFTCPTACATRGVCEREVFIGTKRVAIYSNFPLNTKNNCINKIVYVVHGTSRDAENYYFYALNAATSVGKQNSTMIIAPHFITSSDSPASNDYYWDSQGWKKGDNAINSGPQISSYSVIDAITNDIIKANLFPSLAHIDVTGHSAGGQFAQLYSLTTANPQLHPNLPYRFFVMNPSNYSYLNDLRPSPSVAGLFESPVMLVNGALKMKPEYLKEAGNCPTSYDNYKYGLENRNQYASQFTAANLISQFISRKVYYFLGQLDTNPHDADLDISCPAELDGAYRLIRGENFFNFLNQYFPAHQHILGIVPGVAHDGNEMYNAASVKSVLFN